MPLTWQFVWTLRYVEEVRCPYVLCAAVYSFILYSVTRTPLLVNLRYVASDWNYCLSHDTFSIGLSAAFKMYWVLITDRKIWCSDFDDYEIITFFMPFFSTLKLLVGRHEGHPAHKKLGVGLLVVTIWLELCTSYSCSCHHHFHHL